MNRVTIELWLGLNKELKGFFEPISMIRSIREEEVKDGTSIRQLFEQLARNNLTFTQKIFNPETKRLYPHLMVTFNDRVISFNEVYDKILANEDKITLLYMYTGG